MRRRPATFDGNDAQLILAARLIDGDVALEHDLAAVLQEVASLAGFVAEEDTTELRIGVLEGEINMAGALCAEIA